MQVERIRLVLAIIIQKKIIEILVITKIIEMLGIIIQIGIIEKLVLAIVKIRIVQMELILILMYITFRKKNTSTKFLLRKTIKMLVKVQIIEVL